MDTCRLKALITASGHSQKDIATSLNLGQQRFNYYVTGKREPDNGTLVAIASFFDVSTDYLLGHSDSPTPARDNLLKMAAETDDPEELLALLDIVNKKLQERK